MTFKPTDEQAHARDLFLTGRNLTIEALAGSGKTSTLKLLADSCTKRMLYTSFAASVVRDAKKAFPQHVRSSTNHGLAWATVGRHYADAKRLPPDARLTPRVLQQHFGWTHSTFGGLPVDDGSRLVMETLTRFCQSADPDITAEHVPPPETVGTSGAHALAGATHYVVACAQRVWMEWENPTSQLPVSHDTYLKRFALSDPMLQADVCLLDEAQDTNPLMLGLMLRQTHAQLIVVGDQFQAIYGWRGAINAIAKFPSDHTTYLTQSFRFGSAIAEAANAVLDGHLESNARVRGLQTHASRLEVIEKPPVILARKNTTIISEIVKALARRADTRIAVVGGVDDLMRLVDGAGALLRGARPSRCPELNEFSEWDEVRDYSKLRIGRDLKVLVQLVDEYGVDSLARTLDRARGHEQDEASADLILSTGHKSKGREWRQCKLCDDFKAPPAADATPEERAESDWTPEEARILYVASTRARDVLDVSTCSAWQDAKSRYENPPSRTSTIPVSEIRRQPLDLDSNSSRAAIADLARRVNALASAMGIASSDLIEIIHNESGRASMKFAALAKRSAA
ncbi:MAG: UvrD-helicase domain-containing protein [Dokdonella sp.]